MEYHELQKEGAEARAGADRTALGLSCIPGPVRGDLEEVRNLRDVLLEVLSALDALGPDGWSDGRYLHSAITRVLRLGQGRP
jgi:hypothetical protein